jgi:hypothetical protein
MFLSRVRTMASSAVRGGDQVRPHHLSPEHFDRVR